MLFEEYGQLSDEELLTLIERNQQSAMDFLLEKYTKLVRQKARALFLIGGDKEDLIQEGMIGLYKAVRDYKKEKEKSFYSFAQLCITRQMYSAIKCSNRKKNIPLNTYISLYTPIYDANVETEEKISLLDGMFHNNKLNPEEMVIDKETTLLLEKELEAQLSQFEKEVMQLYISGLKYTEIAQRMEKTPKSIDNAIQRIKSKLVKIVEQVATR